MVRQHLKVLHVEERVGLLGGQPAIKRVVRHVAHIRVRCAGRAEAIIWAYLALHLSEAGALVADEALGAQHLELAKGGLQVRIGRGAEVAYVAFPAVVVPLRVGVGLLFAHEALGARSGLLLDRRVLVADDVCLASAGVPHVFAHCDRTLLVFAGAVPIPRVVLGLSVHDVVLVGVVRFIHELKAARAIERGVEHARVAKVDVKRALAKEVRLNCRRRVAVALVRPPSLNVVLRAVVVAKALVESRAEALIVAVATGNGGVLEVLRPNGLAHVRAAAKHVNVRRHELAVEVLLVERVKLDRAPPWVFLEALRSGELVFGVDRVDGLRVPLNDLAVLVHNRLERLWQV
mmetsp:Transcript_72241/g.205374  ORF Transcript_72241/g.205374 Transcript_72241/m.205374 type:complete len:347 (-) Transcript_72241:4221-5261(-)